MPRRFGNGRGRIPSLLILAALAAAAGCAGRVETVHESPGFARADLAAGRLGLGGVVLGARPAAAPAGGERGGVPADDVLAQAEAWSDELYGALLAAGSDVPVWPWPAVRDACGDSLLADVLRGFGRGGMPRPAELAALEAALGQVRYLALARIDRDETELHEGIEGVVDNQRARDGRDIHRNRMDSSLKTRRSLTVTLEVYDLAAGRPVWVATAERHRDELYNFAAGDEDARPPVVPPGEPVITAEGRPLPTADFAQVLADACDALAGRLLGPPESRP